MVLEKVWMRGGSGDKIGSNMVHCTGTKLIMRHTRWEGKKECSCVIKFKRNADGSLIEWEG